MRPRFELSATQLVATALAAITATVAASYLGVTGTVIGAGLASVVSAIGTAVYTHSLHTTRARVREVVPRRTAPEPAGSHPPAGLTRSGSAGDDRKPTVPERGRWQNVVIASLSVFVAILAVVTGVEVVTGRPLSDLVRGESGSGTSFFGDSTRRSAVDEPAPAPTVTQTVTPSVVVVTPTVTQTAPPVTETVTPTESPPAPSPSDSSVPSPAPTGSAPTP